MTLVVGAAVVHDGRLLAARRTLPPETAGGWELPGGKIEPGETPEQAVVREVQEELGCTVRVTRWLDGEEPVGGGHTLQVVVASLVAGEPVPREGEHDAIRWLGPAELDVVRWLAPDVPFVAAVRDILEGSS